MLAGEGAAAPSGVDEAEVALEEPEADLRRAVLRVPVEAEVDEGVAVMRCTPRRRRREMSFLSWGW